MSRPITPDRAAIGGDRPIITLLSSMEMISLDQPEASLVAHHLKPHETRSWAPPEKLLGQRIGIHATKRPVDLVRLALLIEQVPEMLRVDWEAVPHGAVVATAQLDGYLHVHDLGGKRVNGEYRRAHGLCRRWQSGNPVHDSVAIHPTGDYSVGRFIWLLSRVERLAEPIPARGRQKFWHFEHSDLGE